MVKRTSIRKGFPIPSSSREDCTCRLDDASSSQLHAPDCYYFAKVELSRTKIPENPLPEVKLRRPDGLWPNAISFDVDEKTTEEQMDEISANVDRYLSLGDVNTALYWIDVDYSKKVEMEPKFVAIAHYVMNLSKAREWDRLYTFIEQHHYHQMHLYFAYYYVSAQFNMKMYLGILQSQIGHLINLESGDLNYNPDTPLPLKQPSMPLKLLRPDIETPTDEEIKILDEKCTEMKLLSALLFIFGKTFLASENRQAAQNFIWAAWLRDKSNMEAEELITRYNLPDGKKRQAQWDKFVDRRNFLSPLNDPRAMLSYAKNLYDSGDVAAAYKNSKLIMEIHGMYRPALLLHIAGAVAMEDSATLYLLAHQLVDRSPQDAMSWYAVAMYYFVIRNNTAAKNFINKATMMNRSFGEAWVAFGHILSSENDHEQSLNCYLKALKVLDRHHELHVFMAMEYYRSKNLKLAMDFLKDPQLYAPTADGNKGNPYREHEQGCVHYSQKHYRAALNCYTKALKAIKPDINLIKLKVGKQCRDQLMLLDRFWEPLIGNMAHCYRRLGEFTDAITLYQSALVMDSRRESTLIGLGICYACQGNLVDANRNFHQALAKNPYNTSARQALDRLVQYSASNSLFQVPVQILNDDVDTHPCESLDSLLKSMSTDPQESAKKVAMRAIGTRSTKRIMTSSVKRPTRKTDLDLDGEAEARRCFLPSLDISPIVANDDDAVVEGDRNEAMDTL